MMRMMVDPGDHAGQPNGDPRDGQRRGARSARRAALTSASGTRELLCATLVNKFTIRRGAPRRYHTTIRFSWRPSEMRFHGIALLTGAAIRGACGGEKTPAADTGAAAPATTPAATTTPTADSAATAAPAAGAAATPAAPAAGAAAAAPATGTTHEVKMIGDA